MNFRLIKIFVLFSFLVLSLTGCASGQLGKSKTFNHNAPLIKEDIKKSGTIEVDKTVEMGPKPRIEDTDLLEKRKKIHVQKNNGRLTIKLCGMVFQITILVKKNILKLYNG